MLGKRRRSGTGLLDRVSLCCGSLSFNAEYEALLAAAVPWRDFPDFDENARATTFYTTGTTGQPKGVYFSHRPLVMADHRSP